MHLKKHVAVCNLEEPKVPMPVMTVSEMYEYVESNGERCVIIIDGVVVDVTVYLDEHVSVVLYGWNIILNARALSSLEATLFCANMQSNPQLTSVVTSLALLSPICCTRRQLLRSMAE